VQIDPDIRRAFDLRGNPFLWASDICTVKPCRRPATPDFKGIGVSRRFETPITLKSG
jgi:hypothetical protein